MCNAYNVGRNVKVLQVGELLRAVAAEEGGRETSLIRRTDTAPVVLGDLDVVTMRWGFQRPKLGTINNSRDDKLAGPMWSAAFRERRCLVPVAGFYEWSGPKGQKRTHLFTRPDGERFWIAGIWESSKEFGPCFSMITTAANSFVSSIHDRMPAVLEDGEARDYLDGIKNTFAPAPECLRVDDAPNPLLKKKETPVQGELF